MKNYEKPIVLANNELFEGVFAGSGIQAGGTGGGTGDGDTGSGVIVQCNSAYMNGTYQAPDWNNTSTNIGRYGCNGCPAERQGTHCGLLTDYVTSGYADSYKQNAGNYKPLWESKGLDPNGFTYNV